MLNETTRGLSTSEFGSAGGVIFLLGLFTFLIFIVLSFLLEKTYFGKTPNPLSTSKKIKFLFIINFKI